MLALETRDLGKAYHGQSVVTNLNLRVDQGDIYGFVGRNGSGKSTTMKMICGLTTPTTGKVVLFDGAPMPHPDQTHIGAIIENPGLYPSMSAYENLMCKAMVLGVRNAPAECRSLLNVVGLGSVGKKRVKGFSLGMRQRLGLALALVGSPELLLLDEPMNGLDPEGVREIRNLIVDLNKTRGITVMISSHVIDQLGRMVTRYGIIDEGRMLREVTAQQVADECDDFVVIRTNDQDRMQAVLAERLPALSCTLLPEGGLQVSGSGADSGLSTDSLGSLAAEAGLTVYELYTHQRDIEDYFVGLMGGASHE